MLIDNKIWKTFNGREIPVEQLDSQHLSNIFWYHLLCHKTQQEWAMNALKERFNGQPIQYCPHSEHIHELQQLEEMGYLNWKDNSANENIQVGEIIYGDKCIGIIWRFNS